MRRGFGQRCTGGPTSVDGVVRGVEGAVELCLGCAVADKFGGVGFGVIPVLIVGAEGVGCVGEGDAEFEAAGGDEGRFDARGDFVAVGVGDGGDVNGLAIYLE